MEKHVWCQLNIYLINVFIERDLKVIKSCNQVKYKKIAIKNAALRLFVDSLQNRINYNETVYKKQ